MQTTAIQNREKVSTLTDILESRRAVIQGVLPKHMTADRVIKMATVAVAKNKDLQACTPFSIVNCIMKASELGLDVSGTLGSAYLVPFKGECTLIIGYRGLIDLARRSGQILSIEARVVWANDFFEYEYGLDSRCVHRPCMDEDAGDFRYVYAVAKLRDGGKQFEVLTFGDVERVRRSSRSGEKGPWKEHFSEMAKKTAIRRLVKYLPMSVEFMAAVEHDDDEFIGREVAKTDSRAGALADRLRLGAMEDPTVEPVVEPVVETEPDEAVQQTPADEMQEMEELFKDPARAIKRIESAAKDIGASLADRKALCARHAVKLGLGPDPMKMNPEQLRALLHAVCDKRVDYQSGIINEPAAA